MLNETTNQIDMQLYSKTHYMIKTYMNGRFK